MTWSRTVREMVHAHICRSQWKSGEQFSTLFKEALKASSIWKATEFSGLEFSCFQAFVTVQELAAFTSPRCSGVALCDVPKYSSLALVYINLIVSPAIYWRVALPLLAVRVLVNLKAAFLNGDHELHDWDISSQSPCGWMGVTCNNVTFEVTALWVHSGDDKHVPIFSFRVLRVCNFQGIVAVQPINGISEAVF